MISYNQLLEAAQDSDMGMDQEHFKFRAITRYQGPLAASDPDWKAANTMFKWNGRLRRLLMSPYLLLLLITQSPVQHMPKSMIYMLWKAGIGSGT